MDVRVGKVVELKVWFLGEGVLENDPWPTRHAGLDV